MNNLIKSLVLINGAFSSCLSMNHPAFGIISLKNVVDFIWMYEQRHIDQIIEIKEELGLK
jgi:hypothetical protein